jgi:hypothetical protein
VADVLLYQTMDSEFAASAIEALRAADIACYKTGTSWTSLWYGKGLDAESIFIHRAGDYARANGILIALGAAVEEPVTWLRRPVIWLLLALIVLAAAFVASKWAPS